MMYAINAVLGGIFALTLVVFLADYTKRAQWWKNRIGINLAAAYVFKLLYVGTVSLEKFEFAHNLAPVRTIALSGLIWTVIQRISLMRQAQKPNHISHSDELLSETS